MPRYSGSSVRKCGQSGPHQEHHYNTLADVSPKTWEAMAEPIPVIQQWCPGTPVRPEGQGPGYTVEMLITPDQDVERAPGEGQALRYSRHISESTLRHAPEIRGVLEVICRNVGLAAADAFASELEALIARETGLRPMTQEERYQADRRRSSAQSHIYEVQDAMDYDRTTGVAPERPVSRSEREVWGSGMVPANPAVCRHCGRRIVYAYPNWVRDDDEPGHDPSVCTRTFELGHYHEPEVSQ